jgi:hypothetical protein
VGLILYGLAGLSSASYTVDRNAIVISWGTAVQVIPVPNVDGIIQGMDLGRVTRFRGLRWPGCWIGRGRIEGVGAVQFYCTTRVERQLVIKTAAGAYAISPRNPDRFMDLFATQRAMGISEQVEQMSAEPRILQQGFLPDRVAGLLLATGGILNLALYFFLTMQWDRLPYTLPLHFDAAGVPDRIDTSSQLLTLVALGTAAWLVNGILGTVIYRWLGERMGGYLLWGAAAGLQILLWVAIAYLIKV